MVDRKEAQYWASVWAEAQKRKAEEEEQKKQEEEQKKLQEMMQDRAESMAETGAMAAEYAKQQVEQAQAVVRAFGEPFMPQPAPDVLFPPPCNVEECLSMPAVKTAEQALDCAAAILFQLIHNQEFSATNIEALADAVDGEDGWQYYRNYMIGNKRLWVVPAFNQAALGEDYSAATSSGYLRPLRVALLAVFEQPHHPEWSSAEPTKTIYDYRRLFVTVSPNATDEEAQPDVLKCCESYEELTSGVFGVEWASGGDLPWVDQYQEWALQACLEGRLGPPILDESLIPVPGQCAPFFECCSDDMCAGGETCSQHGQCF